MLGSKRDLKKSIVTLCSALRHRSKYKQPKVSEATVFSLLCVRAKGHGWIEQRDKTGTLDI